MNANFNQSLDTELKNSALKRDKILNQLHEN